MAASLENDDGNAYDSFVIWMQKGNGVSGCAAPDRKRGYHIMKERIKTILLLLGILAGIAYVLMVPVGCLLYAIVNGGFM